MPEHVMIPENQCSNCDNKDKTISDQKKVIKELQEANQDFEIMSPNMPAKKTIKVICVPIEDYRNQKKIIEDLIEIAERHLNKPSPQSASLLATWIETTRKLM